MAFPQPDGLRYVPIRCYSQGVATRRCREQRQQVAIESRLCYSQKVETKAVGLPVASEAAPSAKDAKSLRPSSEATFVGLEEAQAAPGPCRKLPQRTIHRKTREMISRAPQRRRQCWSMIDILRSAKLIRALFRSSPKRFRVRGMNVHNELERPPVKRKNGQLT
jgi:hypothetical protein